MLGSYESRAKAKKGEATRRKPAAKKRKARRIRGPVRPRPLGNTCRAGTVFFDSLLTYSGRSAIALRLEFAPLIPAGGRPPR